MKMEREKFTQKWRKKRRKSDVKEKLASGTLPQCERIRLQKHQLGLLLYTLYYSTAPLSIKAHSDSRED